MNLRTLMLEITFDQALDYLKLDKIDLGDESKLKTAYRTATLNAHPDKGGSVSQQQNVNAAYEFLKKYKGSNSSNKIDWESIDKENYETGIRILNQLKETLNPKNFISYFGDVYNQPFQYTISNERPVGEFKRYGSYTFTGFNLKFYTPDNEIVLYMNVTCDVTNAKRATSLGSGVGNISYKLFVDAYGVYNNKKMKMSARDWNMTTNHDTLINPEITFPKEKLNKFKITSISKQFKKADMIATIKSKSDMAWDGDSFRLKKENITLRFDRGVFMKMPYWSIWLFEGGRGVPGMTYLTLEETVETANFLINLSKKFNSKNSSEELKTLVKAEVSKKREERDSQK